MDGLQSRLETFIGKIKGHIELTNTPELCGLVGRGRHDQIAISTAMANDIVSLLGDCMMGFSALELDAAQDGYAAEESHLLRQRIRTLSDSQANLIRLLRKHQCPTDAQAIRDAESLLGEKGCQLYN
jgi:hypothetical protein